MKRPLVLFSGGVDSSFVMYENPTADRLVIELDTSYMKYNREQAARARVMNWIKGNAGFDPESREYHSKYLMAPGCTARYKQLLPWMVRALEMVVPTRHSSVMIGYLSDDDSARQIPLMKAAWDNLYQVVHGLDDYVPLEFPLEHYCKREILERIPADLLKLTTSCEYPVEEDPDFKCCNCTPCKERFFGLLQAGRSDLISDKEFKDIGGRFLPLRAANKIAAGAREFNREINERSKQNQLGETK